MVQVYCMSLVLYCLVFPTSPALFEYMTRHSGTLWLTRMAWRDGYSLT
jgi:hypothetical protein